MVKHDETKQAANAFIIHGISWCLFFFENDILTMR